MGCVQSSGVHDEAKARTYILSSISFIPPCTAHASVNARE